MSLAWGEAIGDNSGDVLQYTVVEAALAIFTSLSSVAVASLATRGIISRAGKIGWASFPLSIFR